MPPPPPPPPPGRPPPGPPPPPSSAAPKVGSKAKPSGGGAGAGRGALLNSIQSGARLKKTQTNDRSAPQVGGVKPSPGGGGGGSGGGRGTVGQSNGSAPPPGGLGGLFAGGMPKLRPTGAARNTGGGGGAAFKPPTKNGPAPRSTLPATPRGPTVNPASKPVANNTPLNKALPNPPAMNHKPTTGSTNALAQRLGQPAPRQGLAPNHGPSTDRPLPAPPGGASPSGDNRGSHTTPHSSAPRRFPPPQKGPSSHPPLPPTPHEKGQPNAIANRPLPAPPSAAPPAAVPPPARPPSAAVALKKAELPHPPHAVGGPPPLPATPAGRGKVPPPTPDRSSTTTVTSGTVSRKTSGQPPPPPPPRTSGDRHQPPPPPPAGNPARAGQPPSRQGSLQQKNKQLTVPPPPPQRMSSSGHNSSLMDLNDLEARFKFLDPKTFPQPEPFQGGSRSYPSKSQKRNINREPPPAPPR
ncbi:WAS/WASL-interacting protein family member 1-like [Watersipora subatra]|uniref:WAS/WASL-interacting protein family member 1-like n=1 Tax=Watersipora subatra TaxID=2589382 RepID=UPI00355BD50E